MKPRLRQASFGIIVPILAVVAVLVLIEAVFQLWTRGASSPFVHREPDRVLGWRLQAGAQYLYTGPDFRARVEYNSNGWRDIEHPIAKRTGDSRVLVLGDSYMEGYTVDLDDSFHRQLQGFLHTADQPADVINFGVGGFGTLQSYLAFQHFGKQMAPDLVLLAFYFGNDVRNNSQTLELRQWPAGSEKTDSRPFLRPGGTQDWDVTALDYDAALQRYHDAQQRLSERPWWHRSAAYWFYGLAKPLVWKLSARAKPSAVKPRATPSCDGTEDYSEAWRITGRILSRLNREVENAGARLMVFTVPKESGRQVVTVPLSEYGKRRRSCRDNTAVVRLSEMTSRLGIPLLDLGPSFAEASKDDPKALLVRSEGHWNKHGHRLAAFRVHQAIVEQGLIEQSRKP